MYDKPFTAWEMVYRENNEAQLEKLEYIEEHMQFMSDMYEREYIAVGGIALHHHMREKGMYPIELTDDGDAALTEAAWYDFRNEYPNNYNMRMAKHEYKLEEHNVDVDCYVEHTPGSNLEIPVKDLLQNAEHVNGTYCINKVHLLALKLDKQRDFTGSWDSYKGQKIVKDNLQIFALMEATDIGSELWKEHMNPERQELLNKCLASKELVNEVAGHHEQLAESIAVNIDTLREVGEFKRVVGEDFSFN